MSTNPTPIPALTTIVTVGGQAVAVIPTNPTGGIITNPLLASDQGLTTAEPLYVNPVGNAATVANNTTFALQPGETWTVIPGQTTQTTVNAASSGHKFSAVQW